MKSLETKQLLLRPFTEDDFAAAHSYASCAENTIYMEWGPNSGEETRAFIRTAIEDAKQMPCINYQYAVVQKDSNALLGACNLAVSSDAAEIGWILHRDAWGQGYATEMGGALLQFGFDALQLHRIHAHCDAENVASFKVMEKLGMRREGLLLEARLANKLSDKKYGDSFIYALLRDEWETNKEIAYYNALPVHFDGFCALPPLSDDTIHLICTAKKPAIPEKKYVPAYAFAVCKGSEKIGEIDFRVGYAGFGPDLSSLYYGGQIGYNIDEKQRGKGYAVRACRLLAPVAKAHGMTKLLITNDYANNASRRVCEKLGARLLRVARLPAWHPLYSEDGMRFVNVFAWEVD